MTDLIQSVELRLRGATMNSSARETDFCNQVTIGPVNVKLVDWSSLEAAACLGLMSVQWHFPVPQNLLVSGGFEMDLSTLRKVGGADEKVATAKRAVNFSKLLTPNDDIEWEKKYRVTNLQELANQVWVVSGVAPEAKLSFHIRGSYTREIYFGAMRNENGR